MLGGENVLFMKMTCLFELKVERFKGSHQNQTFTIFPVITPTDWVTFCFWAF